MSKLFTHSASRELQVLFIGLVLGFFAVWIVSPIMDGGKWYFSHDGARYPYLLYRFKEAVDHGVLYPRWMPELMGGYGYPTFLFYQPGYFFFSLPFARFADVVTASYYTLITLFFIGGLGAYLLARRYAGVWLALFLAVLFMYSPYLVRWNFFMRGDYSELFAMIFMPWAAYSLFILHDRVQRSASVFLPVVGIVVSMALIVSGHPFAAFWFIPVMVLAILFFSFRREQGARFFLVAMAAMGIAAVLTAPYWLTAMQLMENVTYRRAFHGWYNVLNNLSPVAKTFWPPNPADRVYLVLMYICALAALFRPQGRLAVLLALAYLLLMSKASLFIWEAGYEVLRFMQFPWRINSVLTFLQYLVILQAVPLLYWLQTKIRFAVPVVCIVVAGVLFTQVNVEYRMMLPVSRIAADYYPDALKWDFMRRHRAIKPMDYYKRMNGMEQTGFYRATGSTNEFDTRWMRVDGLPHRLRENLPVAKLREKVPGKKFSWLKISPASDIYGYYMTAHANAPSALVINQFYFPGWKILVDEQEISLPKKNAPANVESPVELAVDGNGRMVVKFAEPGVYKVEAWYDGPPGWEMRNYLMFVAVIFLGFVIYWHRFFASGIVWLLGKLPRFKVGITRVK